MSEEGYIKAPCQECQGRVSLPQDSVGVAFNCPHCGVDLQMLLKHICEHCGGRLSFEGKPEAIGVQIECGHCHQATVLQPSTFVLDSVGVKTEPVAEEEYDEEDYVEEGYDGEYDEEGYDEEDEPEPNVETRRRTGPPKPRPPKRAGSQGGAPSPETSRPGQRPAKMGRTLAGAGAKPKEEESSGGPRKRPRPKRKTRAKRSAAQPEPESQHAPGPVSPASLSRRIAGTTPESQDVDPMDPMGGVVPGGSPSVAGPAGPGPVQRKVAGTGGTGPQPAFKVASRQDVEDDDDEDVPWYKDKEKMKLAIAGFVFLLVFLPFGLPATAGLIFDADLENRIKRITRLQFLFDGGDYRDNRTKEIQIDPDSLKIQPGGKNSSISYVVGDAKNISSRTLKEVELYFHLYDSSDTMLGEVMEYKDEIEPNSTWSFKAVCMFTNVVRADPVKVIVR